MKKLILILLLLPSLAWAVEPIDFSKSQAKLGVHVAGAGVAAAAGNTNPCASQTLVLCEGFNGASGYENSWSESGTGTITENYSTSPAPIETTTYTPNYSLYISASAQQPMTQFTFAEAETEVWGYFLLNIVDYYSGTKSIVIVYDSGGAASYAVNLAADGGIICSINGSSAASATTTKMAEGSTYHVWFHFKNGNGNAICSVGFSSNGTEPTSGDAYRAKTNGTEEDNLTKIGIGWAGNATGTVILDKIRVSDTATLGNNPQ